MNSNMPIEIIPSYPAPAWKDLDTVLRELVGVVSYFQVDIVAEEFAGTKSWPETEIGQEESLNKLIDWKEQFVFELDLMVSDPGRYFSVCANIGIRRVVVHVRDETDVDGILHEAAKYSLQISLATTADISLDKITPYITNGDITAVQLMGIARVGRQGEPFDNSVLSRIRALRQGFPDLSITIDGAVNIETLPQLYAAGANRFAPGSAIIKSSDPASAYKQLYNLIT